MALDWVQNALRESLGFVPYPATLNLKVESEPERALWLAIKSQLKGIDIPAPNHSFCEARCFLVKIEGQQPGAVLLPAVGDYPDDKIEVIAPVRLKDRLGVRDGDRITLEFLV